MMQRHRKTNNLVASAFNRSGVTLMEVLMSVMIMGLGVIPLASLFPISVQRSVQATQLTNATVLRYNAEALIDAFPQRFVFDPDGTLDDNGHIRHQRSNRKYIVDPLGAYYARTDSTGFEDSFGNDGSGSPVIRIPRYHAGLLSQLAAMNYFTQQDSWTLLYEGVPGNPTFPSGINNTRDTIYIDYEDVIEDINSNGVLDSGEDVNGNGVLDSGIVNLAELSQTVSVVAGGRMLMYDTTGKQVQVRSITGANINTGTAEIGFADPLPNNGLYGGISKIRIETLEQRYSYLLTVRRQIASDVASVDVVVFFRRDFSPEFEALHDVENFVAGWDWGNDGAWGIAGYDDDNDGMTDEPKGERGALGSDDKQIDTFTLYYNTNVEKPALKKGGYVFDAYNARWYRIQSYTENNTKTAASVTLDQPIIEPINYSTDTNPIKPGLIVMPNVVQVYPLGNKTR
tara:strand:- start:50577 stop:51944 length:1368 start_codon:yes stop_codon:yes gene_type:complete